MIITCQHCGLDFDGKKTRKYCSKRCAALVNANNEDLKKQKSLKLKEVLNTPEIKQQRSDNTKKLWENPEYRKNKVQQLKDCWSDEEKRKTQSIKVREAWSDPELKNEQSARLKSFYAIQENYDELVERNKEINKRPEKRQKQRKTITEKYKDPDFLEKIEKQSKQYKDYVLPSGKTVKIQGYENFALDELLKIYNEEDLILQHNIVRVLGHFPYTVNNKIKHYTPDIYIKSENKIIEVKSHWTFNRYGNYSSEVYKINKLKEKSCQDKGLNFEFYVLDKKMNRLMNI